MPSGQENLSFFSGQMDGYFEIDWKLEILQGKNIFFSHNFYHLPLINDDILSLLAKQKIGQKTTFQIQ